VADQHDTGEHQRGLGEADHPRRLVDDDEAEREQRVHAAGAQAPQHPLDEISHALTRAA
jgi:hypothetical protein